MNKIFLEHIEKRLRADEAALDRAVKSGIERAIREKPDYTKIFGLAAAYAAALLLFFGAGSANVTEKIYARHIESSPIGESESEILAEYFSKLGSKIIFYLEGE